MHALCLEKVPIHILHRSSLLDKGVSLFEHKKNHTQEFDFVSYIHWLTNVFILFKPFAL
jgi:hypothetical protein